ncbi:hypothetical protein [Mesorhizobium sp. 10J20-29]
MIRILRSMLLSRSGIRSPVGNLRKIAVVGALRSGTNFLKYLLEQNFLVSADFNAFGWKHSGIPVLSHNSALDYPDVPLAYIVKNPYAFAVSLHRYHQRISTHGDRISISGSEGWSAFLVNPIVISDSQLAGSPQMRFANPFQYWNFLYWNLETLDQKRFCAVGFNYEDLIADPETVRSIERVVRLRRRPSALVTPGNQMRRLGGRTAPTSITGYETPERFDLNYYTEKRYLHPYTPEQLAFVRSEISIWLMERRGYRII